MIYRLADVQAEIDRYRKTHLPSPKAPKPAEVSTGADAMLRVLQTRVADLEQELKDQTAALLKTMTEQNAALLKAQEKTTAVMTKLALDLGTKV